MFSQNAASSVDGSDAMPVVSLRAISKKYDDFAAVDNISLDVRRGELLCLLGPSGCGKTTTLRMVAGFVEPTAGAVYISGQDVTALPPYRRDTGMVFQSYALFPHMTIGANIAFGLENIGVPKVERAERVKEMLTLVELTDLAHRYPRELSGGQQQRVALARALALRPAVLLLDEPFSNLDAQLRARLREELRSLIDRVDITTLFVTHDQEEALMLSDRIAVINRGRIEQIGTPEDIYERPESRFVAEFIGWCSILEGVASGGHIRVAERPKTVRGGRHRPDNDCHSSSEHQDHKRDLWTKSFHGSCREFKLLWGNVTARHCRKRRNAFDGASFPARRASWGGR
jgi:putative spermidine/putrescine transport system ATP-binding protein